MHRFGIVGKIWLSIGVSVAGMLTSLAMSQMESVRAEARLRLTSECLFPAAQSGQQAEAAFERMEKGFRDAVLVEEVAALERGEGDGLAAAKALDTAAHLPAFDPPHAKLLAALAADVSSLAHDARSGYEPMVKSGGTLTPAMPASSRQLAERTATIKIAVAAASEEL